MAEPQIILSERDGYHNPLGTPSPPSTYWIDGSRDRYGDAYFVSTRSGSGEWTLWRSNRPYAANDRIGEIEWPPTWERIDALVAEAVR